MALEEFRGRETLVVFWNPGCGFCERMLPDLKAWENAAALRAPAGALFQRAGVWQAFVVEGGRAKLHLVKVGRSNGVETEISDGLPDGAQVVVYPGDKISDGTRVAPLRVTPR